MNKNKKICNHCNKLISTNNIEKHKNSNLCKRNRANKSRLVILEEWKQLDEKYKCPYCNKLYCKNGIATHIWRIHSEEGKKYKRISTTGHIAWNKGLSKETDDRLKKYGESHKKKLKSGEIVHTWLGRKHSNETKEKLSKIRLNFLKENPDKVPYLLNHHSKKESYPEKYFKKLFNIFNIKFEDEYRVGMYSLDIAIIDKKIDIEIDGEQHYSDQRIVKSDIRRNEYLKELNWTIIRIRWSDYQKMSKDNKKAFINDLINSIK